MSEATCLFLAANPLSPRRVTLDAEMRDIARLLDPASCPVSLILRACWSASADGVRRALTEARPAIVHVSGRGAPGAEGSALCELLGAFKEHVRIAVLDGCEGEHLARLAEELDVVVCISASLGDGGARKLAARFYRSLLCGSDVEEAFQRSLKEGGLTIDAPPAQLLVRSGVTASAVRLASSAEVQSEEAEVGGLPCRLIVRLEGSPEDIRGERAAQVKEMLCRLAGDRTFVTASFREGTRSHPRRPTSCRRGSRSFGRKNRRRSTGRPVIGRIADMRVLISWSRSSATAHASLACACP